MNLAEMIHEVAVLRGIDSRRADALDSRIRELCSVHSFDNGHKEHGDEVDLLMGLADCHTILESNDI